MASLRLKTKLLLAITSMVAVLVMVFAYFYLEELVQSRIAKASSHGDFVNHEIYNATKQALRLSLAGAETETAGAPNLGAAGEIPAMGTRVEKTPASISASAAKARPAAPRSSGTALPPAGAKAVRDAASPTMEEILAQSRGLKSLLQSIIGYSTIILDAAVVGPDGRALLHSDPSLQGQPMPYRRQFDHLLQGGFWHQIRIIFFSKPEVLEIRLPLQRGGEQFGDVRVGISTTFMKSELRPPLNNALLFSAIVILVSMLVAGGLSNLVLRPLQAISARLDRMSAGEFDAGTSASRSRSDEYGKLSIKIDRLGRQMREMRDVNEIFSALKENLDQVMATLQDGLMLFTQDWRLVLVSASAEQFAGRVRADILGRQIDEVFNDDTPLGSIVLQAIHDRQPLSSSEIESGGRRIDVSLDFIEAEEGGEQIGALLTMRDAESMRRIENELEIARRLSAIGRLTSGVAHEVKNPINAIVVHLEVLREKLRNIDPDAQRHMEIIGSEIQRLDRVVQRLVEFMKPVDPKLIETDLRGLLEEVVLLASPEAEKQGVHIEHLPLSAPLRANVDVDMIKQALLNVILNGVQAMPHGGILRVRARREVDESVGCIDIRDQGPGIPADIRDQIFNLYFTTKGTKGSGIGLAMTYRVMQLHNGSLDFDSVEGHGATFHLRLPLIEVRKVAVSKPGPVLVESVSARG